jgi:hypothetical protein
VFLLPYRDLSALVSWVPFADYSEQALNKNLEDLAWITPRVKRHEQIVKTMLEFAPVIPVRFCTIYRSRERVLQVLRSHYEEFRAFLHFVQGKEEWGVKIYLDEEVRENLVQKAGRTLRTLDKRISSASPGEGYFLRKRREKIFREEVEKNLETLTEEIYTQISSWAIAGQRNRLLDKRATGKDKAMILNAAFLVNTENIGEFVEWLDRLAAQYAHQGLFFEVSGPWPPYNFCPQVQ